MPRRTSRAVADLEHLVDLATRLRTQVLAAVALEQSAAEDRDEIALGVRTVEVFRAVLQLRSEIDRCSFNFRGRGELRGHVMAAATQLRMARAVAAGVLRAARRRLKMGDRHLDRPRRRGRPTSWGRELVARMLGEHPALTADQLVAIDERVSAGGRFLVGRTRAARRRDARRLLGVNRE
jgi:hypothetical protein